MKALIVGCGKIAGGFNETDESAVLTHALAYRRLGIEIAGCVDREESQARKFAERWQVSHHGSDLAAVLRDSQPEVVSLSTPPDGRREALEQLLNAPTVRAVLLEKPLAATAHEARRVRDLVRSGTTPVLVNYCRAFDPFYQRLEREVRAGNFGRLCSGTTRYYGSGKTNASHWLERVIGLLGERCACRHLSGSATEPLFEVSAEDCRIQFLPSPVSDFSPFELDLLFENCRLRVVDSERRVEFFRSRPDPLFPAFGTLAPEPFWDGMVPSHESILYAVQAAAVTAQTGGTEWRDLFDRAVSVAEQLSDIHESN